MIRIMMYHLEFFWNNFILNFNLPQNSIFLYSCKFAHLKFFSKIFLDFQKFIQSWSYNYWNDKKYLKKLIFIISLLTSLLIHDLYKSYKFKIFKHILQNNLLQNNFQKVVKHLFQTFLWKLINSQYSSHSIALNFPPSTNLPSWIIRKILMKKPNGKTHHRRTKKYMWKYIFSVSTCTSLNAEPSGTRRTC